MVDEDVKTKFVTNIVLLYFDKGKGIQEKTLVDWTKLYTFHLTFFGVMISVSSLNEGVYVRHIKDCNNYSNQISGYPPFMSDNSHKDSSLYIISLKSDRLPTWSGSCINSSFQFLIRDYINNKYLKSLIS